MNENENKPYQNLQDTAKAAMLEIYNQMHTNHKRGKVSN